MAICKQMTREASQRVMGAPRMVDVNGVGLCVDTAGGSG